MLDAPADERRASDQMAPIKDCRRGLDREDSRTVSCRGGRVDGRRTSSALNCSQLATVRQLDVSDECRSVSDCVLALLTCRRRATAAATR